MIKNRRVIESYIDRIKDKNVIDALNYFILKFKNNPHFELYPAYAKNPELKASVRFLTLSPEMLTYFGRKKIPFGFIVNKNWLLFYIRAIDVQEEFIDEEIIDRFMISPIKLDKENPFKIRRLEDAEFVYRKIFVENLKINFGILVNEM